MEAAGDVNTLCSIRPGRSRWGIVRPSGLSPAPGVKQGPNWPMQRSYPRFPDETPEGRSIVVSGPRRCMAFAAAN